MLLRLDAADRLALAVEQRGSIPAVEAASILLATPGRPPSVARSLLAGVVERDARLAWRNGSVCFAPAPWASVPLEEARFAVLDLETTGFTAGLDRIREVGAVVLDRGRTVSEFAAEPVTVQAVEAAVRRLRALANGAVLAGHNVRFDVAFLDQELVSASGGRIASPTVDTMPLARRLLRGRIERASLAAIADFFGTACSPCHRALPDARATAEILLRLVEIAAERGARTVGDLCALARRRLPPVDHLA